MAEYLKRWPLTPEQRNGVIETERKIIVTAGAGTGKTGVLTKRLAHLVLSGQASIDQILAITFTEKAAAEMSQRVGELFEKEGRSDLRIKLPEASISTIHSFCARLLQENAIDAGIDPSLEIVTDFEKDRLVEMAMDKALDKIQATSPDLYEKLLTSIKTEGRFGADIRGAVLNIYNQIRVGRTTIQQAFHVPNPAKKANEILDQVRNLIPAYISASRERPKQTATMEKNEEAIGQISQALDMADPSFRIMALQKTKINLNIAGNLKEMARQIRELSKELIHQTAEVIAYPIRSLLADLVQIFSNAYKELKEERSLLDFSDLEQLSLDFLESRPDGAKKIRQRYKFVMVDEFQDVNPLQAKLVSLVSKKDNLFIVGDHKQSIYGFRQADVTVFQDHVKKGEGVRISLATNFRSEKPIIDFVNHYFNAQWSNLPDDLAYEPITAYKELGKSPAVEVLATMAASGSDNRQAEAKTLVKSILDLIEPKEEKEIKAGDITILFRSKTHVAPFLAELIKNHISFQEVKGRGFFSRSEVVDLQNYLKILADPLDELSLAAVLKSPFVQIDDHHLFHLCAKGHHYRKGLFESCERADEILELDSDSGEKIKIFLQMFMELRALMSKLSLDDLVRFIFKKTGYFNWALAQPDGARKVGNIELCVKNALGFSRSYGPTANGLARAIDDFRNKKSSFQDAPTGKSGNSVTLMTVHSAKGLEAPVIFIADCNHRESNQSPPITFHRDVGVGFNIYLPDFTSTDTITKIKTKEKIKAESIEEDLRLFYVAMTRAKNRLLFSCAFKPDKNGNVRTYGWCSRLLSSLKLNPNELDQWPGKLDLDNDVSVLITKASDFKDQVQRQAKEAVVDEKELLVKYDSLPPFAPMPDESRYLYSVSEINTFSLCPYRYYLLYRLSIPLEVLLDKDESSENDDAQIIERDDSPTEPAGSSPIDFGNAVHDIFSEIDIFSKNEWEQKAGIIAKKYFSEKSQIEKAILSVNNFAKNAESKLIFKSDKIHRELPILWKHDARLIRGKVDLLAKTPKGYWLIDYKTNRVGPGGVTRVADLYKLQMILYAIGIKKLTGKLPFRSSLYLTDADLFVDIDIGKNEISLADNFIKELIAGDLTKNFPRNLKKCPGCPCKPFCFLE